MATRGEGQVNHLTPRRWQGSLALPHISRLTLSPDCNMLFHKYWENFDLLALVWRVAESVLAAAAGRTLG